MKNPVNIRAQLSKKAKKISNELDGAPVIVIVAGSQEAEIPHCCLGYSHFGDKNEGRLRDILGILETGKCIETLNHFPKTRLDE